MNQYIRIVGGFSLALAVWAAPRAQAQEKDQPKPKGPGQTGTVLVLDNDRTLEGEIERVGDQFRLRRGEAISWIPPQASAVLCADIREAYLVLRQRANLRDPDERIRLAQWCVARGLKDEAIAEARGAMELRPDYPPAQRMVRHLESMRQNEAAEAAKAAKGQIEPEMSTALALEMTAPSLGVFHHQGAAHPDERLRLLPCHRSRRGIQTGARLQRQQLEQAHHPTERLVGDVPDHPFPIPGKPLAGEGGFRPW